MGCAHGGLVSPNGAPQPDEAYEALHWLAEGDTLAEVEEAMALTPPEAVDPRDFEAALGRDGSMRRFVVVDDDEALEAMLDAPLEKWRIFLHPSQRQLVYRGWSGPVRVLGAPTTCSSWATLTSESTAARWCSDAQG